MRALWVLILVAACGDNYLPTGEPLGLARDVTIVAHQDDDLLFMQPDLLEAVHDGHGVTNIYVTAGNGSNGMAYAEDRYAGAKAAYAEAADSADWHCGWIALAGHAAEHCRLDAGDVSLVFLGYPDGGIEGEAEHSLLHLWEGTIDGADTIARRRTYYDQPGLVAVIAEAIADAQPTTIRTLDLSATHGRDHSDHMIVGALTILATAAAGTDADLIAYRGYDVTAEPVNALPLIFDRSALLLAHYDACVDGCAACGEACKQLDPSHQQWLGRRYAVGFRRDVSGTLRQGNACLAADVDGGVTFTSCATAPTWQFARGGNLLLGTRCLQTLLTGELVVGDCAADAPRSFRFDDEGRIWAGTAPEPASNMSQAHLRCLVPVGGRVRAELCGTIDGLVAAPVWELGHAVVTTARAAIGLQQRGRAVRLVDLTGDGHADLCEVRTTGLWCAPGLGDGTFGVTTRIDDPAAPLAVDPQSLAVGDLDGDGLASACGRDAIGILCAKAPSFTATRWSAAFADATAATSASLTAIDADGDGRAELCGVTGAGVICAHGDHVDLHSRWPAAGEPIAPVELDGDGRTDWCAMTATGLACAVASDRDVTTDASPWSFALAGAIATGDLTTAAFADLDGDGRADVCTSDADHVSCAHSQGHGFGPRFTVFDRAGAIYLGDLDGDGRIDVCVDDGTAVACSLSR